MAEGSVLKKGTLPSQSGYDIIYWKLEGKSPGVVYVPSIDDRAEKVTRLQHYCEKEGRQFVHFHFSSTGESEGHRDNACMSDWLADCQTVLREVVGAGPSVLVGAGVGGWLTFLMAMREPELVHSILGMGVSPDVFERIYSSLAVEEKRETRKRGFLKHRLGESTEEVTISLSFVQDASKYHILDMPGIEIIGVPVYLVHGTQDTFSPPSVAVDLMQRLRSSEIRMVEGGDHRLARPEDLDAMVELLHRLFNPAPDDDGDSESEEA